MHRDLHIVEPRQLGHAVLVALFAGLSAGAARAAEAVATGFSVTFRIETVDEAIAVVVRAVAARALLLVGGFAHGAVRLLIVRLLIVRLLIVRLTRSVRAVSRTAADG